MKKRLGVIHKRGFRFLAAWAASFILIGALLCTLLAKLYWAIHVKQLGQYPSWIAADILVLAMFELLCALICFSWHRRWAARSTFVFAALICTWSVINAGWLITTGTQALPAVIAPLFYDPLSRLRIVGNHLILQPFAAVTLIVPSIAVLAFFFYILARPVVPTLSKKHIRTRINVYAVLLILAMIFAASARNSSKNIAFAELRYNSQFKAVQSLFFTGESKHRFAANTNVRKMPLGSSAGAEQLPLLNKKNAGRVNVVIVVLESISPVETRLFNKDKSKVNVPFLKNLAWNGTAFTNCHTSATHTTKAIFGIQTGRYPSASQDYVEAAVRNKPYQSIATILKNSCGYRTAFFQSAAGTFEARPGLAYNLGFDKFFAREDIADTNSYLGYLGANEFALIEPICQWIKMSDEPFFLTVLGSAAHDPYELPRGLKTDKNADIDDAEQRYRMLIKYTDSFLAELYKKIHKAMGWEKLIFCVVGDHGEAFGQHSRYGHARIPYEEATKVFWIMRGDKVKHGKKINLPVSNIDVAPTLLNLLGFDITGADFDGVNASQDSPPDRKIYFSTWMRNGPAGFIADHNKFIYDPTNEMVIEFDLTKDPCESEGKFILKENYNGQSPVISEILRWQKETFINLPSGNMENYRRIFDNWLCQTNNREPKAVFNRH